ncbi:MAG: hypothetical protein M0R03_07860 [Novosphingobium sp.]|nr:hypothetical protein [Novosphingobium sp.]
MEIKEPTLEQKSVMDKEKYLKLLHAQQKMLDMTQKQILERNGGFSGAIEDTNEINALMKEQWEKHGYSPPKFTDEELERDVSKYAEYKLPESTPKENNGKEKEKPIKEKEKKVETIEKSSPTTKKTTKRKKPVKIDLESFIPEIDNDSTYDLIELDSKGLCYPKGHPIRDNNGRIAISFLTTEDEDLILNPSLYRDNLIFDVILRRKIKNANIDPNDLIGVDRDKIILFLRASGYGPKFSLIAYDNKTEKEFETEVDLTTIKGKEIEIESDDEGLFEFKLPLSNDIVKFKFLSISEEKAYLDYAQRFSSKLKESKLYKVVEDIEFLYEHYNFEDEEIDKLEESKNKITEIIDGLDEEEETFGVGEFITKRMCMQVKEYIKVNGEEKTVYKDEKDIEKLVKNMRALDGLRLREYIEKNTPKLDLNMEVPKPESLGGGTLKFTFPFTNDIFFNIPQS